MQNIRCGRYQCIYMSSASSPQQRRALLFLTHITSLNSWLYNFHKLYISLYDQYTINEFLSMMGGAIQVLNCFNNKHMWQALRKGPLWRICTIFSMATYMQVGHEIGDPRLLHDSKVKSFPYLTENFEVWMLSRSPWIKVTWPTQSIVIHAACRPKYSN